MFLDAAAAHMMKMAVVEVVGVPLVANRGVAATGAVTVCVILMFLCGGHPVFPLLKRSGCDARPCFVFRLINVLGSGLFRAEGYAGEVSYSRRPRTSRHVRLR